MKEHEEDDERSLLPREEKIIRHRDQQVGWLLKDDIVKERAYNKDHKEKNEKDPPDMKREIKKDIEDPLVISSRSNDATLLERVCPPPFAIIVVCTSSYSLSLSHPAHSIVVCFPNF